MGSCASLSCPGGRGRPPATQSETVGQHTQRTESHGRGSQPWAEQDVKHGVQQTGSKRNAEEIVYSRPNQVFAHDAYGGASQIESGRDDCRIRPQEQNVASLFSQVCACAHGDADVCLGKGCSIVDAVPNHRYAMTFALQCANARQFAGRVELSLEVVYVRL